MLTVTKKHVLSFSYRHYILYKYRLLCVTDISSFLYLLNRYKFSCGNPGLKALLFLGMQPYPGRQFLSCKQNSLWGEAKGVHGLKPIGHLAAAFWLYHASSCTPTCPLYSLRSLFNLSLSYTSSLSERVVVVVFVLGAGLFGLCICFVVDIIVFN